jgi:HAMP domain-containing protein
VRRAWNRLGLRGRLALSIGTIVVLAFAVVFVAVRAQMAHESDVISHEEAKETGTEGAGAAGGDEVSPIEDAQSDVEKTFFAVGGASLLAALLAGYLVAARTASPLRRFAATAAEVDAGALQPRLDPGPGAAAELRTLAEAFNHMLDRLDRAFEQQRRFVSDASHELRSPLTAIRGQLEVLARAEEPSGEEVRRVEAVAMAEMGRVERLVDDLLSLARLDEGAPPAPRDLPAAGFLRELAAATPAASWPRALSAPTPTCSPASSATCSTTRTATPAGASSSPRAPPAPASWSPSTTTAPGSPPPSGTASSTASTAASPAASAPRAAAALASASPARSSLPTAAGSGSRRRRSGAPASPSSFPASPLPLVD